MREALRTIMEKVRVRSPLIHNITNFVVMEVTANALLAVGASPLMAQAVQEMDDLESIASALVLNIGTLDSSWINSMEAAAGAAHKHKVPIVLDPVGAGASRLRTESAHRLLKVARPALVRGNASEIIALTVKDPSVGCSKGVDSLHGSQDAEQAALALAKLHNCAVSVSGEVDLLTDGTRILRVHGGTPLMTRVTGLGCSATAISAAMLSQAEDHLLGAAAAMAVMAEAGDQAKIRSGGPGTFLPNFLDALYHYDPASAAARVSG